MDNSKSKFGLLLEKISLDDDDDTNLGELSIYNINDLTNDEFNMLIQNFFENDNCHRQKRIYHKDVFCEFTFGYKKYDVYFLGERDKLKKGIIKFFNFLKNIVVQTFYFHPFCLDEDDSCDDDIVHLIGNIIKNSNIIEYVFVSISSLKDNVLKILHSHIVNHTSLKRLGFGCSKSKMSDICVIYLDDIIKNSNIEKISGLHVDDYKCIFESLLNNFFRGRSPDLNLYNKNINDDLIFKLSDMIKKKGVDYLMKINLSYNKITSKEFSMLVDSLLESKNENITTIYMHDNKLDDNCIESLGELIKKNKNITHIDLGYNDITDKGIEKLFEYIIGNTFIGSINLCGNCKITDVSSEVIKHMIKSSSILLIILPDEKISKKNMDEIEELLKIPIEEREIPLITFQDVKSASKRIKE